MPRHPAGIAPESVVILDSRLDLATLIASIMRECRPEVPVGVFLDLHEAGGWIARARVPVLALVDVVAADGDAIARACAWRRRSDGMVLVAMFDEITEGGHQRAVDARADHVLLKPSSLSGWRACCAQYLAAPVRRRAAASS